MTIPFLYTTSEHVEAETQNAVLRQSLLWKQNLRHAGDSSVFMNGVKDPSKGNGYIMVSDWDISVSRKLIHRFNTTPIKTFFF